MLGTGVARLASQIVRATLVIGAASPSLLLVGCRTGERAQMGFTLLHDDRIAVLYRPCDPGRKTFDIYVEQGRGFSNLVWHLRHETGAEVDAIQLGVVPGGGWLEVVPFSAAPGVRTLVAFASEQDGRHLSSVDAEAFDPERLQVGTVLVPPSRVMTVDEFEGYRGCD